MVEFVKCPHCGDEVLEADLVRHWDEKKCVEATDEFFWNALKEPARKTPCRNKIVFVLNKPARKVWVFLPRRVMPTAQRFVKNKLDALEMLKFQRRWMEE